MRLFALFLSDIIRVTAFQKMVPLVGYFLRHTLPKLQASRVNSLILKSLPLLAIRRLSWSNTAFRASVVGVSSPTDATLVSYMYRGAHNQQRPRDLTQPAWQWQQFTNPTTQGRWFWRMADGEWFNMSPAQYVGYGPAGTWHRYEDPTSRCCFWWRHNDDWDGNSVQEIFMPQNGLRVFKALRSSRVQRMPTCAQERRQRKLTQENEHGTSPG